VIDFVGFWEGKNPMVDKTLITKWKIIQIVIPAVALPVCIYTAFYRCKMNCQDHWLYWEESALVAFALFNISLKSVSCSHGSLIVRFPGCPVNQLTNF